SADALNYMALAGWDTKDMLGGIDGVMQLAAASGEDLGQVSDIVTDSLTAFGMKAKDSGHFADVLAQTSSKANTDVRGLGEAFKYAAPVAGALGYTVEDTSIAIGLMSNAGIKGEKAGTALRTMFTNLSKPTGDMKKKMDELGISITDSNGNMLPMRDVMDQLRGKFKNLSKEQQANAASTIFGKEAMSGALAIINASDEDYQKLTKSIDGSKGAANRMSKEMEGGIGGSLRQMKSAIESLAISIGDVMAPYIKKLAEWVSHAASKLNEMPKGTQKIVVGLSLVAAAIGPLLVTLGVMVSTIGSAMTVIGPLMTSIRTLSFITKGWALATGFLNTILSVAKGQIALQTVLTGKYSLVTKTAALVTRGLGLAIRFMTGPIGLVITAVGLLVAAIVHLWRNNETFRNNVIKIWNTIKDGLLTIWNGIKTFGIAVWNGLKTGVMLIVQTWWTLLKSYFNIWKAVITTIFNTIKNVIVGVWNTIKSVTMFIINAWKSGITAIFNGLLIIIKGILNLYKNAFINTWNLIKFAVISVARAIASMVINSWNNIKNATIFIFNLVKGIITTIWNSIKSTMYRLASGAYQIVKNIWYSLSRATQNIFSSLRAWISSVWSSIKNSVVRYVRILWDGVKRTWYNLFDGTRNIFNRVKSFLVDKWDSIKRAVTGIASDLWGAVKRTFNNMKNGLANIIDKIKGHIGGMVSAIKKGLNGLIDGLNWVGSKLSLPKIPKLSTGTQRINRHISTTSDGRLKQGTMAVVGDKGPGNGKGIDGRRELIEYPNGRVALTPAKDTTTFLPKGSRVISGSMRQQMLSTGTLPHFSIGTWFSNAKDWVGGKLKGAGEWLSDKVGDVLDYMDDPAKLFNKLLSNLGINFDSITKGMGLVGDITRAAFNKIKKGAIDWMQSGFDSLGGELVGGILDPDKINYHYGHTAAYTAATGRPFHEGVDFPFVYQTVRTPMGGRLTRMPFMHGGYGNYVKITSGAIDMLFAHLKDFSKSPASGSTVRPGDVVGLTGNTGFSTGPHLHFEMRRNGRHFDPEPYLRKAKANGRLNVGGGKGYPSGSGATYASRIIRQAQNVLGGRYKSRHIHDAMMRLAKRESNYQPNAVNNWDINAQRGTPSKGLFQMIQPTFMANAKSGYTNFNNPLHQGISALQYIVRRYGWGGFNRAAAYAYKTGGLVHNGLYHLGDDGYPEWIIPTDPSRADDAAKLLALASNDISKNKRPKHFSSTNVGGIGSNEEIANKDYNPIVDILGMGEFVNRTVDKRERDISRKQRFNTGGAFA
ncbi:phage tail tape measure protein, partial [Staphylococcus agnetis]